MTTDLINKVFPAMIRFGSRPGSILLAMAWRRTASRAAAACLLKAVCSRWIGPTAILAQNLARRLTKMITGRRKLLFSVSTTYAEVTSQDERARVAA